MEEDLKKVKAFIDRYIERLSKAKVFLTLFILLIASYFAIGVYQIKTVGVTIDEVAHIGAAYAMSNGIDANLEHPPLMKLLNGQVLKYLPGVVKTEVTPSQYETGRVFLYGNPKINDILFWSRLLYLVANSLILFYLLYISIRLKQFSKLAALILAIFYVFSPSFYSHNYLLTFDVIGSTSLLMTLISVMLVFRHWSQSSNSDRWKNYLLLCVTFTLALLTKFSNVLLIAFFGLVVIGLIVNYYRHKKYDKIKSLLTKVAGIAIFAIIFIYAAYSTTNVPNSYVDSYRVTTYFSGFQPAKNLFMFAFDRVVSGQIDAPLWKFVYGTMMTLGRSGDQTMVFINGNYQFISFGEFSSFLFWFKENSAFYLALGLAVLFIIRMSYVYWNKFKVKNKPELSRTYFQKIAAEIWKFRIWYFISIPLWLPVLYGISASRSYLVIGYRHFYPVLIAIYFGLTWLLVWASQKKTWWRDGVAVFLLLYVLTGLIGVSQNLSYVNFFWNRPKWQLVSDSTLNWGQELQSAYQYLQQEELLDPLNSNKVGHAVFDVPWYTAETYFQVDPDHSRWDSNNYRTYVDVRKEKIRSSGFNYLILDSVGIQRMWAESQQGNAVAKENYEFIQSKKPIFEHNKVIFIYKLSLD